MTSLNEVPFEEALKKVLGEDYEAHHAIDFPLLESKLRVLEKKLSERHKMKLDTESIEYLLAKGCIAEDTLVNEWIWYASLFMWLKKETNDE